MVIKCLVIDWRRILEGFVAKVELALLQGHEGSSGEEAPRGPGGRVLEEGGLDEDV